MDWVLSLTSCLMIWWMGNKSKWGPRIGLFNQTLWIYYTISTRQYGLLPGVFAYTLIQIRNCILWERS